MGLVFIVFFAYAVTAQSEKCVTSDDLATVIHAVKLDLNSRITLQNEKIAQQEDTIIHLTEELRQQKAKIREIQHTMPEAKYQFSSRGCLDDVLSLSCPENGLINITYAEFGQHYRTCSDPCCAPNPQYDCTEDVATNAPEDWIHIKYLCDNKPSCSYQYNGATISGCEPEYIADYMLIFYDCLQEPNYPVVGFTAWASVSREYVQDEVVLFDEVDTNIGGHYNPSNSAFTCPYHGTYLFSLNILADINELMYGQLMKESTILATAFADYSPSTYNQASASVITECFPGQVIWIKSLLTGVMYSSIYRYSHFTGYLMQLLD